jgi:hypothetical protein
MNLLMEINDKISNNEHNYAACNNYYEEDEEDKHESLISFFQENNDLSEKELTKFAKEHGLTEQQIHKLAYALLSSLLKIVGKNNAVPDSEFDTKQLEMGTKIEMEHTDNKLIAKMIAKDHLKELPDYYTRLRKMENE